MTTRILKDIRDEIRATRSELGGRIDRVREELSSRIDLTNQRLDEANERVDSLAKRQVEAEVRLATEVVGVAGAVRELRDVLLEDRQLRQTVQNHEERISALERTR